MSEVRYRVFLENASASRAQLDLIQEIIVEQSVDAIWEARLLMYICVNDRGLWVDPDAAFDAHKRVRIEIDPCKVTV